MNDVLATGWFVIAISIVVILWAVLVRILLGWINRPAKFCATCGKAKVMRTQSRGFDPMTGAPFYEKALTCPDARMLGYDCLPPAPPPVSPPPR